MEAMGDGLIVVDQQHRFLVFNQEARRIMGVGPDEPRMDRWSDYYGVYLPDKVTPYPTDALPLVRALRGERDNVTVYVRPPGSIDGRWVNTTLSPVLDGAGDVTAGVLVFRDVTDQVEARNELAESKRRLEQAQRVAHVGSWEWDLGTGQVTWTDEHFRLMGVEPQAVTPSYETFIGFIAPEDRGRVERAIQNTLQHGQPYRTTYRVTHADGSVHVLQGQGEVIGDAQGKPLRMFGVTEDITEEQRAEEAIRRSHALLKAQQAVSLDGILVIDEHRSVIDYNQRFLELWGIPTPAARRDEVLLEFVLPKLKHPETFLERVQWLYEHPTESSRDEVELIDGRTFDRYSAPIASPEGRPYGRVWYFRDMTDRKLLEQQLQRQFHALQELDRLKSDFVNAVTHELRTPLTSIMGYAEFLEEGIGGALSSQQLEFVHELVEGSKRLEALLNDLLDFARLEAGTFRLAVQPADLHRKIHEILASLRPQAHEAALRLVDCTPDEPLFLPMDAQRVGQVLINLITNAIKFTKAGGTIRIGTRREGDEIVCFVEDTGIGIDAADLPKLFNRFTQLETGLTKKAGVGLGLSISKSIIEAHGGRIGVESQRGQGSTFWFALPAAPPGDRLQAMTPLDA